MIRRFCKVLPISILLGACAPSPTASQSASAADGATIAESASTAAPRTADEPTSRGVVEIRISTVGVEYAGKQYAVLEAGKLPRDPEGIKRVEPSIFAWAKALEAEARARFAASGSPASEPTAMPVDVIVAPEVHPTTVLDLVSLLPKYTGGVYRLRIVRDGRAVDTPLATVSTKGTPGPRAPERWACAGVQQPALDVVLSVRGDAQLDTDSGSIGAVMLRHAKGSAPNWARFEEDVRATKADVNCITWLGAGDALRFDELVQGVAAIWRIRGKQLPIVFVPLDGPEG